MGWRKEGGIYLEIQGVEEGRGYLPRDSRGRRRGGGGEIYLEIQRVEEGRGIYLEIQGLEEEQLDGFPEDVVHEDKSVLRSPETKYFR